MASTQRRQGGQVLGRGMGIRRRAGAVQQPLQAPRQAGRLRPPARRRCPGCRHPRHRSALWNGRHRRAARPPVPRPAAACRRAPRSSTLSITCVNCTMRSKPNSPAEPLMVWAARKTAFTASGSASLPVIASREVSIASSSSRLSWMKVCTAWVHVHVGHSFDRHEEPPGRPKVPHPPRGAERGRRTVPADCSSPREESGLASPDAACKADDARRRPWGRSQAAGSTMGSSSWAARSNSSSSASTGGPWST